MRIDGHIDINAPRDQVWEVVSDPCCYPTFMAGVTRWDSATDRRTGLGARYVARLQVGSAPVGGLIEITEFDEPADLSWSNVTGLDHRGRWRLRDIGPGQTRASFRIVYQSPGGLLGLLADRGAAPMVRRIVDDTLAALKAKVEGRRVPRPHQPLPSRAVDLLADGITGIEVVLKTGLARPPSPRGLVEMVDAVRRLGVRPASGAALSAARFPNAPAVIDDRGEVSYRALDRATNAIAHGLQARHGVTHRTVVGILCRNHRYFVEASLAVSKLGADMAFLNTGFSAPQVAQVCDDEGIDLIIHDEEFADRVAELQRPTVLAWRDGTGPSGPSAESLDEIVDSSSDRPTGRPNREGRIVILTSGTTGRPKGARRGQSDTFGPALALLSRIPYRLRDTTIIAPPLFHAWGFTNLMIGLAMSSTIVLRRRFEPAQVLADIHEHRARVLVAVPVMLQRLLDVPDDVRARHDTSSLRVVPLSGSALSPQLSTGFMDAFGDVIYNLYGSTEAAWATIADPRQLRAAPGTAGTPPRGTLVRILDDRGIEQPRGRRGAIFVGSTMSFTGYTGGGDKRVIRGLIDTGDVGRFDAAGRLFVEGRSDDMIVSGGENVFPQEVEDLIAQHPDVAEAAVVGVDDPKFGQRLAAFVVPAPGSTIDPEAVKGHVGQQLARHKVPRDVTVVDHLPRNATGKVVKKELVSTSSSSPSPSSPSGR